jgi:hypothetical protein
MYVIAKQGCGDCNDTLLSKVKIDGASYKSKVGISDLLQTSLDGTSGFMINNKKKLSFFVYFDTDQVLAFPDLDKIGK